MVMQRINQVNKKEWWKEARKHVAREIQPGKEERKHVFVFTHNITNKRGGARGVMVIVVGIRHDDTSSNPGRDWLHFT